jgi:hypothetical protein
MADDGYTTILYTTDVAQGEMLAELLRSEGIEARFHSVSSTLIGVAPYVTSMTVDVPVEFAARAKEFLSDLEHAAAEPQPGDGSPARHGWRRRPIALLLVAVFVGGAGGVALTMEPALWWRSRALRHFAVTCTADSLTVWSKVRDDRAVRFSDVVVMIEVPGLGPVVGKPAVDDTIVPLPAQRTGRLGFALTREQIAACSASGRCQVEANVVIEPPDLKASLRCAPDWNDWTAATQGVLSPRVVDGE